MQSSPSSDFQHIEALLQGDPQGVKNVYDRYFSKISGFIRRNNGADTDAEDIFQEALIVILHKAREADFKLTSSFFSFLYGICRNLWLKQLRKKTNQEVTLLDDFEYTDAVSLDEAIFKRERQRLYRDQFALLSERCQKMLRLFYEEQQKMSSIAKAMGFANDNVAKKEKSKCKKKLTDMIQADARFADLRLQS